MTQLYVNRGETLLNATLANGATSATILDGSVFPAIVAPDFMLVTLENGANMEIVKITAHTASSTTITIARGQEGTTQYAGTWAVGTTVKNLLTAGAKNFSPDSHFLDGANYFTAAELSDITSRTGSIDVSGGLNAATQAAITAQKRLILPTGLYKIDSPWVIWKWSGSAFSFFSFDVEGDKMSWTADYTTQINNVTIKPSFVNRPAVIIQNARALHMKNITIIGLNAISLTFPSYPEMMTNSTFVTGSCRDSRYSPYAGIAIDPFGASVPADGGYPGMSSYYVNSGVGSSELTFDEVKITNFVAAVVISPDSTPQGDQINFNNCSFEYNKTGLSVCQAQSRGINWVGGRIYYSLYCFDGSTYGDKHGYAPAIFGGIYMGKYLFNVSTTNGTQVFTGMYAESFASIGFIGYSTTNTQPVTFIGCSFLFTTFTGIFADWHLYSPGTPVEFIGCNFMPPHTLPSPERQCPLRFYSDRATRFSNCTFNGNAGTYAGFPLNVGFGVPTRSWEQVVFDSCIFEDPTAQALVSRLTLVDRSYTVNIPNGTLVAPGCAYEFLYPPDSARRFRSVTPEIGRSLGSKAVTIGANGTATFTASDGAVVCLGDLISITDSVGYENSQGSTTAATHNSLGIVTNVATNTVTVSGVPQSVVAAGSTTYNLWLSYIPRYHEPSVGDTATNTTISNVSPTGAWKNGQHIRGAGIVEGTYIVSGGGTATLTLSKATTATANKVRLFDAELVEEGSGRTTFSNADTVLIGTGDLFVGQVGTMSASRTVTLPLASGRGGQRVTLADESGSVTSAYTLVLARSGSDTIDGQTSVTIGVPYGRLEVISDGTSKWTLNRSRKRRQEFTGNGTWTAPAGVTCVTVTCVGGGGGGGEGGTTNGGGGGGAGAVVTKTVDVSPGTGYTVTVGTSANGAAQSGTPATGTDGNTTSFGSLVYAYGGKGGQTAYGFYSGPDLSIFAPPGVTYYGLPGFGTISPSSGSAAANANSWWGNAGAAAGTGGTASQRGGAGGTGYGGTGGTGGNGGGINAGGNAAANTGAGGGGGGTNGTTCGAGGNGGSGLCIVEWIE